MAEPPPAVFLLVATILEVSGDAVVRFAIYHRAGIPRVGLFLAGATLLLGYGSFLNLAPIEFNRVVGLYIRRGCLAGDQFSVLPIDTDPADPFGRSAGRGRRGDHHVLESRIAEFSTLMNRCERMIAGYQFPR